VSLPCANRSKGFSYGIKGTIQGELGKIGVALVETKDPERYNRLYAAQQALAWALNPAAFRSPLAFVMGRSEGSGDCLVYPCPPSSADTDCQPHSSR
jgi:hypothetical protein